MEWGLEQVTFLLFILPTLPTLVSQEKGNISESSVEGK